VEKIEIIWKGGDITPCMMTLLKGISPACVWRIDTATGSGAPRPAKVGQYFSEAPAEKRSVSQSLPIFELKQ
jgi:hypothetical protein